MSDSSGAGTERERQAARNRRAIAWLAGMALLAAGWLALMAVLPSITGAAHGDGVLGVVLGLYVSSFPARHFVDLLVYWRTEQARFATRRSLAWWLALNGVVLLAGWLVIVFAAARFTMKG